MTAERPTIRLDKWLWQARFVKSRGLAAGLVRAGKVRLNAEKTSKPGRAVGPGDTLTFPQGGLIRVVRIHRIGTRRGPAPEAQALYTDLGRPDDAVAAPRDGGNARPTGKARRDMDRQRGGALD